MLLRARIDLYKLDFQMPKCKASSFNQTKLEAAGGCQRWQDAVPNLQEILKTWVFFLTVILHAEETRDNVGHWNTNLPCQYSTLPPPKPVHSA